ncbi:Uncharacterized protein C1840.07c, partial [Durusdinium trenchii]
EDREPEGACGHLAAKTVTLCDRELVETTGRVVVMADVHGDGQQFVRALKTSGLVDDALRWTGGDTVLVQTGDVMDRGPDTERIFEALQRLQVEAREAGGCVAQVLGNHELLNLAGDFTYADQAETANFGGPEQRFAKLGPEAPLGKYLRGLPLAVQVVQRHLDTGSNVTTVLVHAGIAPWLAKQMSVRDINEAVRGALKGASAREIQRYSATNRMFLGQGPVWTRIYAMPDEAAVCSTRTV